MFLAVLTHAALKLHWSPASQYSVCTADAVTPYNTSAQITLMYVMHCSIFTEHRKFAVFV